MLEQFVDLTRHNIKNDNYTATCRSRLDSKGVLCLPKFLKPEVLHALVDAAAEVEKHAYFTTSTHNVYLTPKNPELPKSHVFNLQVVSTKGCVCDDIISANSPLRHIYNNADFKKFICQVVGVDSLFPYEDPLSSINIHYAPKGKELGWHFDNSEFAITLLLQAPEAGGEYHYIKDLRDANAGEMNFEGVKAALEGRLEPTVLPIEPGTLVLFRGRNSLHRVTPTKGKISRYLVVLAYNGKPGVSLSETARQTFYGRVV